MDNSHKPKVLLVHNYYQMPGGEDTVVANERKLLEEHGHEVVLYHRNNSELKTFSRLQKILLPTNNRDADILFHLWLRSERSPSD